MDRPNIVMIMADDMGAWAMGCAQNKDVITPNIDALAEDGVLFENFFCASPVCSPARASVLTGTMPSVHGVHDWISRGNLPGQQFNGKTMPEVEYIGHLTAYTELLAESGYECALSGKWHLGSSLKPQKGFSRWFTIGQGGCNYFSPDVVEDGKLTVRKEYVTDLITRDAVKNIRELSQGDKPFYLSVHYTAPHCPWDRKNHKERIWKMYRNCRYSFTPACGWLHPLLTNEPRMFSPLQRKNRLRGYYSAMTGMDEGIGEITAALKDAGIYDNTVVIFTSDNGMSMGHHGVFGKGNATYPQNMYDSAVKVPFIISGNTLGLKKGTHCTGLYSHCDIMPTLIDMLSLPADRVKQRLPGKSFAPLLRGEGEEESKSVVVTGEYGMSEMIRTERYKLVVREGSFDEFYDLLNDPGEKINLAGSCPPEAEKLKEELARFMAENSDPVYRCKGEDVKGSGQVASLAADKNGAFDAFCGYRSPFRAKRFLKKSKSGKIR